ncbi:hypothetical protein HS048_29720 [Planomonospora sp. ID91781]|uniref:DUF6461 domain-containing protein n=1 Tax=Planomonospora sp. ID91781 TaxID=2738135 RepID=UPI0018C42C32|nr:DUF6461 domain-containing protein [Planomonospora sp. ID91781]MBG0824882.1 hypothetical protein [Planomonospora sp. ID91781]
MVNNEFDTYNAMAHLIFEEPTCITWTNGSSLSDCIIYFGGDPASVREADFEDIYEDGYDLNPDDKSNSAILLDRLGEWTVIIEPTSSRGISTSLLKKISHEGVALSFYWTVNHDAYFKYAKHGHLLYSFDPLRLEMMDSEEAEVSWATGNGVTLDEWNENWLAASLALAENITSIRLDEEWLQRPHLGVIVGPVPHF